MPDIFGKRLIVALDTTDLSQAEGWARAVAPHCGLLKLGLEFFLANGRAGVRAIRDRPIFLDLKLHDIPNTVAGGVRAILPLAPRMLTLHAAGGGAMIEAARKAADSAGDMRPMLLVVTVLTSLGRTLRRGGGHDRVDALALRANDSAPYVGVRLMMSAHGRPGRAYGRIGL